MWKDCYFLDEMQNKITAMVVLSHSLYWKKRFFCAGDIWRYWYVVDFVILEKNAEFKKRIMNAGSNRQWWHF